MRKFALRAAYSESSVPDLKNSRHTRRKEVLDEYEAEIPSGGLPAAGQTFSGTDLRRAFFTCNALSGAGIMNILHTSDWHLGHQLYGRRRHEEFEAFLAWLQATVRERRVETLLLAGDVFDSALPGTRAQEMYYLANGKYSIPVEDLDVDYTQVCELDSADHRLDCPFAYVANITGPNAVAGANRVRIFYHSRGIGGNLFSGCDATISLWLQHSSYPNVEECTGYTDLGNYLCKSMNLDS